MCFLPILQNEDRGNLRKQYVCSSHQNRQDWILLENGVLVLQRTYKFSVACVLVATKSSQTLRHALDEFAEHFYERYSEHFDNPSEVSKFATAIELVEEHFGFVPESE